MQQKELISPGRSGQSNDAYSSVSDYIIAELARHGVTHIYGYPGAAIIPLMAAIDRHPTVEWVLMRNEAAAALAASAQAKLSGQLAACMTTAGPGATNMITGLLDAKCDAAPVIVITGEHFDERQVRYQDLNSNKILDNLLSHSVHCHHLDQLAPMLKESLGRSQSENTVVHLSISYEVQSHVPDKDDKRFVVKEHGQIPSRQPAQDHLIEIVGHELDLARHIVIAVGPDAVGCGSAIEELAAKLNAPIITTLSAKGIINEDHPCCMGVISINHTSGASMDDKLLTDADTILSFGVRDPAPFIVGKNSLQTRTLYQCERDFSSITHKFNRQGTLIGPLRELALALIRTTKAKQDRTLLDTASAERQRFNNHWKYKIEQDDSSLVHPVRFLSYLNEFLEPDSVITIDTGDNAIWSAQFLKLTARQRILASENFAVMGFALPAAIATSLARPNSRVIAIIGDGGLQMTIGELATAAQYGANFILIILNNGVLGRIHAQQKKPFGGYLKNPDFMTLADAYGFPAQRVDSEQDIQTALKAAFAHRDRPFIIEVRSDSKILAPTSKAGEY